MSSGPLISVIMPAFNAEKYIRAAIESVVEQSYENWELLIVNDGSTDGTDTIILSFSDSRIRDFKQENKGVSAARNLALKHMNGAYFCFLDSDDVLPKNSIESRYKVFASDQELTFVDGATEVMNTDLSIRMWNWKPSFKGNPLFELLSLSGSCFLGPTWMIKRLNNQPYNFEERISHAEDLLFCISISANGMYAYTNDCVLTCRLSSNSAMSNLKGLEAGYLHLINYVRKNSALNRKNFWQLKLKIINIMFRSFLKKGELFNSLGTLKYIFV